MKTTYKKVYTQVTPNTCKGITSYKKQNENLVPQFEECIELSFEKEGTFTNIVITKQTADQLRERLSSINLLSHM